MTPWHGNRDRIAFDAAHAGISAGAFLDDVVAREERDERMRAVGDAYRHVDEEYLRETAAWDGIDGAGSTE